ncbi:MAG: hypothetical protein JJ879_16745, partial [Sneathiella sp.]|nr:hypothetical protein [Sneathiella sp.]
VPLFTAAAYFQRYLSGFPLVEQDDFQDDIGFLLVQYTLMSVFGNLYLLPYYYGSKPWSPSGDTDPDFRQLVADSTGISGVLARVGLSYRDFNTRREFWAEDRGGVLRSQYGWYALYVLQMYFLYHLGSAGYYTGYAFFGLVASSTSWGFDWSQYSFKWVKNIVSLQLSPASSPMALINGGARRSITLIREVSPLSPETGWFFSKTLGAVGGLRIAKYMDSAYASDHRIVEWLIQTDRRQLPALTAPDARIIEIDEEEDQIGGRDRLDVDIDIEMQPPNVPMSDEREDSPSEPRAIERRRQ